MDLKPKTKQAFWETPRNLAVVAAIVVTITAAVFGWVGYDIGRTPPAPIVIQLLPAPAGAK